MPRLRNGALIAFENGKAATYGLDIASQRGTIFIGPGTEVYIGMIIGLGLREDDLEINVAKTKKLTNMRAAAADITTVLTPPTVYTLEQSIDFLEDDELLEVTPTALRLRKKILDSTARKRHRNQKNNILLT